ncbi:hypothetical protein D9758_012935 [Tetrapyrgos nigripes]|uniref:Uncharacterized protein n=1 Tax=Tetrapyrgos nigripes TaxID=182062 RepID=A0A8H5CMG1_9AGAR|nr:hypothetical protein D9758_012935 [Tetrapyrgos nigripes]
MSTRLALYGQPPPLRSSLFKNPPDGVPPIEELEALQAELKVLKQKSMDRAKKAGEDLKVLEESMRKMKEKEKGKQKAMEKVKRERDCTFVFTSFVSVKVLIHSWSILYLLFVLTLEFLCPQYTVSMAHRVVNVCMDARADMFWTSVNTVVNALALSCGTRPHKYCFTFSCLQHWHPPITT